MINLPDGILDSWEEWAKIPANVEYLVQSWITYNKENASLDARKTLSWTHEAMFDLCRRSPETSFDIVLSILNEVEEGTSEFAVLAAGPLEDLLAYNGPEMINKIERTARQNKKFRILLGGVWKNSINDSIWKRIETIVGKNKW